MRVTMNDIANELNVSVNTVSKALAGKAKVSDELREKIINTAKKMGYVKNRYAASLATNPLKIGVIIAGYSENYYRYTLLGLNKAFTHLADGNIIHDISLFAPDINLKENVLNRIEFYENENFDAIIFNDVHFSFMADKIKDLSQKGIKCVLLNYDIKNSNRCFVVTNNYKVASSLAAEQIAIALKHSQSKNVLVYSDNNNSYGQAELCMEFEKASESFGLDFKGICKSFDEVKSKMNTDIQGIYVSHAKSMELLKCISKQKNKPELVVSDLYPELYEYFENGTITASVFQNPEKQAYSAVINLYNIFSGSEKEKDTYIEPILLFKSNYKLYD